MGAVTTPGRPRIAPPASKNRRRTITHATPSSLVRRQPRVAPKPCPTCAAYFATRSPLLLAYVRDRHPDWTPVEIVRHMLRYAAKVHRRHSVYLLPLDV